MESFKNSQEEPIKDKTGEFGSNQDRFTVNDLEGIAAQFIIPGDVERRKRYFDSAEEKTEEEKEELLDVAVRHDNFINLLVAKRVSAERAEDLYNFYSQKRESDIEEDEKNFSGNIIVKKKGPRMRVNLIGEKPEKESFFDKLKKKKSNTPEEKLEKKSKEATTIDKMMEISREKAMAEGKPHTEFNEGGDVEKSAKPLHKKGPHMRVNLVGEKAQKKSIRDKFEGKNSGAKQDRFADNYWSYQESLKGSKLNNDSKIEADKSFLEMSREEYRKKLEDEEKSSEEYQKIIEETAKRARRQNLFKWGVAAVAGGSSMFLGGALDQALGFGKSVIPLESQENSLSEVSEEASVEAPSEAPASEIEKAVSSGEKIGVRGPEGTIIDYFKNNSEVAKKFGWDGEVDIDKWAGSKAHSLWVAHAEEAIKNSETLKQLEELGYSKDLEGYAQMMKRISRGVVEINSETEKISLANMEYLKAEGVEQVGEQEMGGAGVIEQKGEGSEISDDKILGQKTGTEAVDQEVSGEVIPEQKIGTEWGSFEEEIDSSTVVDDAGEQKVGEVRDNIQDSLTSSKDIQNWLEKTVGIKVDKSSWFNETFMKKTSVEDILDKKFVGGREGFFGSLKELDNNEVLEVKEKIKLRDSLEKIVQTVPNDYKPTATKMSLHEFLMKTKWR